MKRDRYAQFTVVTLLATFLSVLPTARSAQVTLAWDPPERDVNGNLLAEVAGYRLYYGTVRGEYTAWVGIEGDIPQATVTGLVEGATYYMAATACVADGQESTASDELVCRIPDMTAPDVRFDVAGDDLVFVAGADGMAVIPDLRGSLVVSDNCSALPDMQITQSPLGSASLELGENRVIFTACDMEGNTNGCVAAAIVVLPGGNPTDVDADELADAWEYRFFGALSEEQGAPSGDLDGDGFSNLQEFTAGTSPTDPKSCARLNMARLGGQRLSLAFPALGASGVGYEGRRRYYTLQRRDDLVGGEWGAVPGFEDILADDQTVICGLEQGARMGFYRLVIRLE